jgi:uncharacterized RDD family membrane protein YckC
MTAGVESGLVTGEAVELDLRVARLASRATALLIDLLIMWSLFGVLIQAVQLLLITVDSALAVGMGIVVTVGCLVGYPVIMETTTRGRSIGKMALGLRVISEDGGPVRFRQALIRGLSGFAEFFMFSGAPALICSLFNRRSKRLGDVFAGTLVIQDRVAASALRTPVAQMPPMLAGWAQSLELSQISDDLALSARQYLMRFWELLPEVRELMGARLAGEVAAKVSPPPPPGVRPEIMLSAVLAERRRREEYRLAKRRERREAHLRKNGLHVPVDIPVYGQYAPGYLQPTGPAYAPAQPPGYGPPPRPGYPPPGSGPQPAHAPQFQPAYAPPQAAGFAQPPQPGSAPQFQPAYAPSQAAGYAPAPQPGSGPHPQPSYAPPQAPGYGPPPQPGSAPRSHPVYAPPQAPGYEPPQPGSATPPQHREEQAPPQH